MRTFIQAKALLNSLINPSKAAILRRFVHLLLRHGVNFSQANLYMSTLGGRKHFPNLAVFTELPSWFSYLHKD